MCSGDIAELCKWTVVRIDGTYFVLGELLIPPLVKQDLGSLPPFQDYAIKPTGQGFCTGT